MKISSELIGDFVSKVMLLLEDCQIILYFAK